MDLELQSPTFLYGTLNHVIAQHETLGCLIYGSLGIPTCMCFTCKQFRTMSQ